MRRIAQRDIDLSAYGQADQVIGTVHISRGSELVLRRVSPRGGYPAMYTISGYPQVGELSRGVLTAFLRGFDPRPKRPERTARA